MRFLLLFILLSACATERRNTLSVGISADTLDKVIARGGSYGQKIPFEIKDIEKFKKEIEAKARSGNIAEQLRLAYLYFSGLAGEKNYAQAIYWYQVAANKDSVQAHYYLGLMAERGYGQLYNYKKAAALYRKALQPAPYPFAFYRLGLLYEKGRGVPQNALLALKNFNLAAQQNNLLALEKLGEIYLSGRNVLQNHKLAQSFLTRAAKRGSAEALYHLGVMKLEGRGIEKDLPQAYVWFSIASALGSKEAQSLLKKVEEKIDSRYFVELHRRAQRWMNSQLKIDE